MNTKQATIHYLYNSGFAVKTQNHFLIFDYYRDDTKGEETGLDGGIIPLEELKNHSKISVFVSHSHGDHFNPVVFEWEKNCPTIRYFLSWDIPKHSCNDNFHYFRPYQEFFGEDIYVKAYGSTDMGISFLVRVEDLNIFHAGDLNCWYWYYESTAEELEVDKTNFIREIDKMKDEKVDIAFFPVDPRLKEYYLMGGKYFIETIKPQLFIPMHFGEEYSVTRDFAKEVKSLGSQVAVLSRRGEEVVYP